MKNIVQKFFALFQKPSSPSKRKPRKSKGQSLVEVAIAFPLLIMLFSGMVEFGFMLNTYLSLLDATRQTARAFANENPFQLDTSVIPNVVVDKMSFYNDATRMLLDILHPPSDPQARSIVLDPTRDDIIISVISVHVSDSTRLITAIDRFPGGTYFRAFNNQLSVYADDAHIRDLMTKGGTADPVRTGVLIIEVYFGYDGLLKLPWVTAFLDTITLHADTVMPLVTAKPARTP